MTTESRAATTIPGTGDSSSRVDDDEPTSTGRGFFTAPVAGPVERTARRVDARTGSPWRAAAGTALVGYLAIVVVLAALGWLLVHAGFLDGLRSWDQDVNRNLADGRTVGWTDLSRSGSSSAETMPIVLGGVIVTAVLAALRRWWDLLFLPLALAIELLGFLAVNYLVDRPRPDVERLGITPDTHSFPSGHAAATMVLWGGIVILLGVGRRRLWIQILAWAIVTAATVTVSFSRVYRGMHHVTDVVAGALLGIGALLVAMTATRAMALVGAHDRQTTTEEKVR